MGTHKACKIQSNATMEWVGLVSWNLL